MKKSKRFSLWMVVVVFAFLISSRVDGSIPDSSVSNKQKSASPGIPVPDSKTAIRVAMDTWASMYDAESIAKQKPYSAELLGETWYVHGSRPVGFKGPVYGLQINKKDGKIIRIIQRLK